MGDWNVIIDPKIGKVRRGVNGLAGHESSLIDLLAEYNLVDGFHLGEVNMSSVHPLFQIDPTWIEC